MTCVLHLFYWARWMIKQVIRLIRPGLFLPCFAIETPKSEDVLVRPRYLSICAADQRYFQGNRPPEVLAKKLPLALFHEAIGEVLRDPLGEFPSGSFCVLLPGGLESDEQDSNYKKGAFFRSSNADGFCQEVMAFDRRELLKIPKEPVWPYVFTELMSVCCQALRQLESITSLSLGTKIGIWGDGAMAFMMALTLSELKPECSVTVLGKHDEKLINFSFVEKKINVADKTKRIPFDVAIECVGGLGSQSAIHQAVDDLNPKGVLLLMGVTESLVALPTRLILEKGLTLLGSSRSVKKDFEESIQIITKPKVQNALNKIVSLKKSFSSAQELIDLFREDTLAPYKTLIMENL